MFVVLYSYLFNLHLLATYRSHLPPLTVAAVVKLFSYAIFLHKVNHYFYFLGVTVMVLNLMIERSRIAGLRSARVQKTVLFAFATVDTIYSRTHTA